MSEGDQFLDIAPFVGCGRARAEFTRADVDSVRAALDRGDPAFLIAGGREEFDPALCVYWITPDNKGRSAVWDSVKISAVALTFISRLIVWNGGASACTISA